MRTVHTNIRKFRGLKHYCHCDCQLGIPTLLFSPGTRKLHLIIFCQNLHGCLRSFSSVAVIVLTAKPSCSIMPKPNSDIEVTLSCYYIPLTNDCLLPPYPGTCVLVQFTAVLKCTLIAFRAFSNWQCSVPDWAAI